jgi:hypothetical protein
MSLISAGSISLDSTFKEDERLESPLLSPGPTTLVEPKYTSKDMVWDHWVRLENHLLADGSLCKDRS